MSGLPTPIARLLAAVPSLPAGTVERSSGTSEAPTDPAGNVTSTGATSITASETAPSTEPDGTTPLDVSGAATHDGTADRPASRGRTAPSTVGSPGISVPPTSIGRLDGESAPGLSVRSEGHGSGYPDP